MVRNAMKWLDANGIAYEFFDYRRETLDPKTVDDWFARAGLGNGIQSPIRQRSRELPESEKAGITERRAKQMILAETNLIKRPILDTDAKLLFGFKADVWAKSVAE